MALFPKDEIKRKTFHALTLLYIAAYVILPYRAVVFGMGLLVVIIIIGEVIRLNSPGFNSWILNLLGGVHRPKETNKISGLPWTVSGSFFTMLIFHDKRVVILSLLYLALGDAFAALFGRRFGRHKIAGEKTLEGSIACFVTCLAVGLFFFPAPTAFLGAAFITAIELVPWPLNDNFWIPLFSASFLALLTRFL